MIIKIATVSFKKYSWPATPVYENGTAYPVIINIVTETGHLALQKVMTNVFFAFAARERVRERERERDRKRERD